MYRQEVANLFAGFITRPESQGAPDDPIGAGQSEVDDDGTPIASPEPGTRQELGLGESVTFSSPPDAGDDYAPLMGPQLMAATAAATGRESCRASLCRYVSRAGGAGPVKKNN